MARSEWAGAALRVSAGTSCSAAAGGGWSILLPLSTMEGSPLPVLELPGRAGPRPCLVTPWPGLSTPQPPAPLWGRQQHWAVPMLLVAVPSFVGNAWPPRRAPTDSSGAIGWRGAWRGASQLTACTALVYRAYVHAHVRHVCPCCVCEGDTRVRTCALSACVLCHQIPLPVQAICLPPSPCTGLVPGSTPGYDHL